MPFPKAGTAMGFSFPSNQKGEFSRRPAEASGSAAGAVRVIRCRAKRVKIRIFCFCVSMNFLRNIFR
jgi:hypothetical protein